VPWFFADRGGVVGLLGPFLGAGAKQFSETLARFFRSHGEIARRRRWRALLPFVERLPGAQAYGPALRFWIEYRQRRQHCRSPGPAAALGAFRDGPGIRIGLLAELLQQSACRGSKSDAGFGHRGGRLQAERHGETAWGRDAEPRRANKGEQFEQVERGEAGDVEPPRGGAGMAHHDRLAFEAVPRLDRGQRLDLAIGRQPNHLAETSDDRRCPRHQNARLAFAALRVWVG
jgi:hypothetical protein